MNTFIMGVSYQVDGVSHIGSTYLRTNQSQISQKTIENVQNGFNKDIYETYGYKTKSIVFSVSSLGFISDKDWEGME